MQVIILASGRGTRMAPLTDTVPKPMLTVLDKNLITWKLEALPQEIDEIILIVGYLQDVVRTYFGSHWNGIPIRYIEQPTLNGTGGAVALAGPFVKDKALVLMGDDIYERKDLENLIKHDFAMLVHDEGEFGRAKKGQVVEREGLFVGLNEGNTQSGATSSLINTGACVISKEYFTYPPVQFTETEYGLPHTLLSLTEDIPVHVLQATRWIQITTPQCLERAAQELSNN